MKNVMIKAKNINGETAFAPIASSILGQILRIMEDSKVVTDIQVFKPDTMKLDDLPEKVQAEAKDVLKAYNRVNVIYEYSTWHVSASICVKSSYGYDHFFAGTYYAKDVYTEEERRQNFFEAFGYQPYKI